MTEQAMVECGFDMGEGKVCHAMVKNHPMSKKAHLMKEHGVGKKVKPEATQDKPAEKPKEFVNPDILRGELRSLQIQQEQLESLRSNAPDVQLGGYSEVGILDQKTALARKLGVLKPDESECWYERKDVEQARSEGRRICHHLGEYFAENEMVLTGRPQAIADHIDKTRYKKLVEDHNKYVSAAKEAGVQSVKAVAPQSLVT